MNYHLANFHHFNHLIISAHQIHGHCIWIWFIQWKKPGKKKSVSHSILSDSFATPWTVTRQAPLSKGFSRQEYWSRLPFPFPGHLPDPWIEPRSPAWQADSLPSELPWVSKPNLLVSLPINKDCQLIPAPQLAPLGWFPLFLLITKIVFNQKLYPLKTIRILKTWLDMAIIFLGLEENILTVFSLWISLTQNGCQESIKPTRRNLSESLRASMPHRLVSVEKPFF